MRIKRKIYTEILDHLSHQEITLIVGSRQAGKTTIIKQLQTQLEEQGEKTLFFNLDIESDFSLLETQERLLFAMRNQVGEDKAYIFIDEFLDYQTNYEFENKQEVFAKIYPERAYLYLLNYMTFGGYPQLTLVNGIEEKRQLLQEIYNSYLVKDVTALL